MNSRLATGLSWRCTSFVDIQYATSLQQIIFPSQLQSPACREADLDCWRYSNGRETPLISFCYLQSVTWDTLNFDSHDLAGLQPSLRLAPASAPGRVPVLMMSPWLQGHDT